MTDDPQLISFLLPIITTLLIGSVISGVYYLVDIVKDRLKSTLTSSITLESSDNLFQWVFDYLIMKGLITNSLNNISLHTERKTGSTCTFYDNKDLSSDMEKPDIAYMPSAGFHSFRYKDVKINVFHEIGNPIPTGRDRKPTRIETITLSCFGPWNIKLLKGLCEEAMSLALDKDKGNTNIYALARYDCFWEKVQSKKPRPFHTVILDTNIAEIIIDDIKNFKQTQQWYIDRGVPYRRGYMLHGPPGTGKTSFVLAVAAELNLSICPLNLSGNELDDDKLNKVLENAPQNSIILLEDVDAIFVERTSVDETREGRKVSFSGLLNAIDGVRSQEGRILFMSTNHIEKLDPALLRPGRADLLVKLDYASMDQIRRMFQRFYPEAKECLVEKFLEIVPENKLSMAKLQGHFLRNKGDPERCLMTAGSLIENIEFTNEMSITCWLSRLNLDEFASGFLKEHIRRVMDLKGINEGNLEKFGIKKAGDKKRIMNMIKGEDDAKKAFLYMSHQSIRSLLSLLLKDSKEIENFVKLIPEGKVTEFQLRDIFEKDLYKSYELKVKELLERLHHLEQGKKPKKTIKLPARYPKETPLEVLERLGMQKYIPKFIENDVIENEFFYKLDIDTLDGEIGVDNIGLRKILMKEIETVNKKNENEEWLLEEALFKAESLKNVLKKSSSIQY